LNERDRRVATLAVLFAPDRAPSLLARLTAPGDRDAVAHAAELASLSRRDRLGALATALAVDAARIHACAEAAASSEGTRLATLLRTLAAGRPEPRAAPILVRLCRERVGC
jgi:hypothetical protein